MARRRRDDHGDEHPDERWLITYADVLTLMFVLFMVLFSISVVNTGKFDQLKDALQQSFGAGVSDGGTGVLDEVARVAGLEAPVASSSVAPAMPTGGVSANETAQALESQQLEAARRAIDAAVADAGLKERVTTTIDQRGLTVRLATDGVLFDSGSAAIRPDGASLLVPIAASLRRLPNPVRVEGHTDTDPIATAVYPSNWELSGGRAAAVLRALAGGGVPTSRLEFSGFGQVRPIASNDSATGRAANRRVEVLVTRLQGTEPTAPAAG